MFQEMFAYIEELEDSIDDMSEEIGECYKSFVKKHTHVDTGNLINSYQVQPQGNGTVTVSTAVPYAIYCEFKFEHFMFNKGMFDLMNSGFIEFILGNQHRDTKFDIGVVTDNGIHSQGGVLDDNFN